MTTVKNKTLSGLENLNRVLPTGTVFLYQLLSPFLTNSGQCSETIYKYLTATLVGMCGLSCFITSFTDSYYEHNVIAHYGFATTKGKLWPPPKDENMENRVKVDPLGHEDFVHGFLAVFVFGVIVCLDRNTADCFYPLSESQHRVLLEVLPPVVGAISSVVLLLFPNERRGIGYLSISKSSNDSAQTPPVTRTAAVTRTAETPAVTRTAETPAVTRTEGSLSVVSVVSCICR